MENDYYKILGIHPSANEEEIKRAYKRMALKFHPDKNKDPNAGTNFNKVAAAYRVLSDPKKRVIYDHKIYAPRTGRTGSSSEQRRTQPYDSHGTCDTYFGGSNLFNIFFGSSCQWCTCNSFADHSVSGMDYNRDDSFLSSFSHLGFNSGFHHCAGQTLPCGRKKFQHLTELCVSLEEILADINLIVSKLTFDVVNPPV